VLPSRQPPTRKKLPKKKPRPPISGNGRRAVPMAVEAAGFPSDVLDVLGHVAVDAAQIAVDSSAADQAHCAGVSCECSWTSMSHCDQASLQRG
jgi:hypothetical protein